jgi:hypothetical protein
VRAALAALAVLVVICRMHFTIWLAGIPVASVSVGALLLTAALVLGGAAVTLVVVARHRDWLRLAVTYGGAS